MKRVVVGIISRKNTEGVEQYLLVSSKKYFGIFTGYYYPPGGHLEEGEEEVACLKRELKEELDLEVISCKKITETPGDVQNQITSWYKCEVKTNELKPDHTELEDAGYFSKEEIFKMKIWPATKDFFEKHIFSKE